MAAPKGNQFAKGHGRPPKARETALLLIASEILNAGTWRQVVTKRVLDALGKKQVIGETGQPQLIDDPESTAQGRNASAAWLRDTVIGKPTEYIREQGESAYDIMSAYSDEELELIRDYLTELQRANGIAELGDSGTGPAAES